MHGMECAKRWPRQAGLLVPTFLPSTTLGGKTEPTTCLCYTPGSLLSCPNVGGGGTAWRYSIPRAAIHTHSLSLSGSLGGPSTAHPGELSPLIMLPTHSPLPPILK